MAKKILTPAMIEAATCVRLLDPLTPGLLIETLPSGRKRWQFRRRIPGTRNVAKLALGQFSAFSIADAREWAGKFNLQVETGVDPRIALREEAARQMTVPTAHSLYMEAVREGRSSSETAKQTTHDRGQARDLSARHRAQAATEAHS